MRRKIPLQIMRTNADAMAERLKLLSHSERLLMLCRMAGDEVTVSELVELTGMSQSAVSQHLVRRDAQARYYTLVDEEVHKIIDALCDICVQSDGECRTGAAD